jgi:hypothetical protein
MDQIVAQSLTTYGKIENMKRKAATVYTVMSSKVSMSVSVIPSKPNGSNGNAIAN